jgi:hypothetical protein
MSGSTDGLVCLYDLSQMTEDEALYQVIKDDSVSQIGFFGPSYEYIYLSTHMETSSLWTFENTEKIVHFGDVRGASNELNLDYIIGWKYNSGSGHLFLEAGSQR